MKAILFLGILCAHAQAQTQVDLRTQGKSVDFATAASTRPVKTGAGLPGTCKVGELFWLTTAPPGANLYGCPSANSWTLQAGSTLPSLTGNAGKLLSTDNVNLYWSAGDVSCPGGVCAVIGLEGRAVSAAAPVNGQALVWNASTIRWEPQTQSGGTLSGDANGPSAATVVSAIRGRTITATAPFNAQVLAWNSATAQWEPTTVAGGGGGSVVGTGLTANDVIVGSGGSAIADSGKVMPAGGFVGTTDTQTLTNKSISATQINSGVLAAAQLPVLAGDASGAPSGNTVAKIQGNAVAATAPTAGQALVWNALNSRWEPTAQSGSSGGNVTGTGLTSNDVMVGAGSSAIADSGKAMPAGAFVGTTDSQTLTNKSIDASEINSGTLSASRMPGNAGDVTSSTGSIVQTVVQLQGRPLTSTGPTLGQTLVWNGSAWSPGTISGGGGGSMGIALDGTLIGTRPTLNLVTGTGVTSTLSDNGSQINLQLDISTPGITTLSEIHFPMGQCTGPATAALAGNIPPTGTAATAGGCNQANSNDAYAVFANTGTPSLQFSFTLPSTLLGTANVSINYTTGTAGGAWTPALDVSCSLTNGTAGNDPAFTANNFFHPGVTTAPATANWLATVSASGLIWPAGCTAGNRAHFRLIRTDTGTAVNVNVAEVVVVARRSL